MILRDGGLLILVAIAMLIGAAIFATHDPGDKTGYYTPECAVPAKSP